MVVKQSGQFIYSTNPHNLNASVPIEVGIRCIPMILKYFQLFQWSWLSSNHYTLYVSALFCTLKCLNCNKYDKNGINDIIIGIISYFVLFMCMYHTPTNFPIKFIHQIMQTIAQPIFFCTEPPKEHGDEYFSYKYTIRVL